MPIRHLAIHALACSLGPFTPPSGICHAHACSDLVMFHTVEERKARAQHPRAMFHGAVHACRAGTPAAGQPGRQAWHAAAPHHRRNVQPVRQPTLCHLCPGRELATLSPHYTTPSFVRPQNHTQTPPPARPPDQPSKNIQRATHSYLLRRCPRSQPPARPPASPAAATTCRPVAY